MNLHGVDAQITPNGEGVMLTVGKERRLLTWDEVKMLEHRLAAQRQERRDRQTPVEDFDLL